jgi:hypothetical protein
MVVGADASLQTKHNNPKVVACGLVARTKENRGWNVIFRDWRSIFLDSWYIFDCWCSLAVLKQREGFNLTGNTNNGVKIKPGRWL